MLHQTSSNQAALVPLQGTLAELIQDLTQDLNGPIADWPRQSVVDVVAEATSLALGEQEPVELAASLAAPPKNNESDAQTAGDRWFLGIDLGTTGISAVLLNPAQATLYPLYWQTADGMELAGAKKFRLSTTVTCFATEPGASPLPTIRLQATVGETQIRLSDWKACLGITVPHYSPQTSRWEPQVQWSTQQVIPLRTFQEALQQLLTTLNPNRASFLPLLTCGAMGLELAQFQTILRQLDSVIVGYPSNCADTYSLNVREAILQAELVQQPDQIVFVEDAIAALLSALPAPDGRSIRLAKEQAKTNHLHNAQWQGTTLILTAGASVSELVLVHLPPRHAALNHTDFYVRSLPVAGQAIDQDIFCQLLYPTLVRLATQTGMVETSGNDFTPDAVLPTIDLTSLRLLEFPHPAELDWPKRWQLQQRLADSSIGQQCLLTARLLKIKLQHQPQFVWKCGEQTVVFTRQQLTSQVILPYVQRLNRELNTLLAQTNTTAAAVKQVICTGGTASLGAIARWLRQKLPNATIVQDTYARSTSPDLSLSSCSRVAYGLATVPLHPQVIDQARHQFSDYLLLRSLLQTFPANPAPIETIMQRLEQQGIDTQACRFRILALLEGHLPPGLIPAEANLTLLQPESAENPDYAAIRVTPLFTKLADRTYEANRHQLEYVQQYLETWLADMEQLLDRPLPLGIGQEAGRLR